MYSELQLRIKDVREVKSDVEIARAMARAQTCCG